MKIAKIGKPSNVDIECDGYLPLQINFDSGSDVSPRVWRTGDFNKTLVEVSCDAIGGEIVSIVLVSFDNDKPTIVDMGAKDQQIEVAGHGVPVADLSEWNDTSDLIDCRQEVTVRVFNNSLLLTFGECDAEPSKFIQCGAIFFDIDQSMRLRGVLVSGLSGEQVSRILSCGS